MRSGLQQFQDEFMGYMNELGTENDFEKISQAQLGNLDAFNHLVLKYQEILYNHAYGLLGISQAAEDATQESIIKAYRKIDTYKGGSVRTWLFRIVTNTCYDEMRRLSRTLAVSLYPEDDDGENNETPFWLVDPGLSVLSMIEQSELSKVLCSYLKELPGNYRSAITLIDLYEYDYQEAAEILNIPLGTLKSRLCRGRLYMKKKLQECIEPVCSTSVFSKRNSVSQLVNSL
jgi:RNA polymerase sigma-70 factor, ECF subfamily